MTGMVVNLLVNIIMAVLLAVTISYCWMLNRRIKILQDSKSELSQLLKHFDESTQRASESIIALQSASKKIGENIQMRIDKANYLLDDLAFMLDKGSKLSDQLEANMAVSRAQRRAAAQDPSASLREERPVDEEHVPPSEKTHASLEAVLERMAGRGGRPAWPKESESAPPRSRSEQELVNLLKAGLKG